MIDNLRINKGGEYDVSRCDDLSIDKNLLMKRVFGTLLLKILLILLVVGIFVHALPDTVDSNSPISGLDDNFSLSLSETSSGNESTAFNMLVIGLKDTSKHGIDFTSEYYLFVSFKSIDGASSGDLKFFGNLAFPVIYPMNNYGNFTVTLVRKYDNMIISKEYYSNIYGNKKIVNNIDIINNTIIITNQTNILDEISNEASNKLDMSSNKSSITYGQEDCSKLFLKLEKTSYVPGERIWIEINSDLIQDIDTELAIVQNENVYRFIGELASTYFMPNDPGDYRLLLKCGDTTKYIDFEVINENPLGIGTRKTEERIIHPIENISIISNYSLKKIVIKDSKGKPVNADIKIYNAKIKQTESINNSIENISNSYEYINDTNLVNPTLVAERVELGLENIEGLESANLRLENLEIKENEEPLFSIENVPGGNIGITSGNVVNAFAMDLSNLNFTNGSFIKIASGKELWKCKEWNFNEQKCYGKWNKIMSIVPGQYYSFEVSPGDPGYAETGVATVNTNKSTYHINESAEIIMVVLDNNGYLVANANVTLIVTVPDNSTIYYSTDLGNILAESRGIYIVDYNATYIEGTYGLFVQAVDIGVNYSMSSSFEVKSFYEFDILRNMPVTMDPWNENFEASITLISYNYTELFSFIEQLPVNFTIVDAGGATITYSEDKMLLTWNNLANQSTVYYSASVPFVTPDLYEIGPAIVNYGFSAYNESRPWFLAVDPIAAAQVCAAQINSNAQDTFGSSCDGTYNLTSTCVSGGDLLTCNDGLSENHSATQNNRWAGVRISSYNSSITYCQSITSVDLCYEWWRQGTNINAARIAVDRDADWDSPTTISSTSPGTSANPGVTCTSVTASEAWDCSNFNGSGTAAQAVAQIQRTNSGGVLNLTIDVLYFNVTYTADYPPNVVSLNYPANGANISSSSISFNFTATDDKKLQNCSLYMNISGWTIQGTKYNVTNNTNTNITIAAPSDGYYLWNIRCYDNATTVHDDYYTSNYTIKVDRTGPVTILDRPYNLSSVYGDSYIVNATVTDALNNISTVFFFYRQNFTASWASLCNDTTLPYSCNWNTTGLMQTNTYQVMAYANDSLGNIGANDTHINITIDLVPPSISNSQCYADGSWINCTNVSFGDILGSVRTNCSSNIGGSISNVSFMLRNIDDNYVYFNSTVTSATGSYWEYNFVDFTLYDSGLFNLNIVCRENPENSADINWSIPFGTLSAMLISPNTNINVTRNQFFNFTSRVTCTGGECGYINATLDPANWWDSSWRKRVQINITNVGSSSLTNFPAYLNITYDADMLSNYNDLRFINGSCDSGSSTVLDYEIEYSDANHSDTWIKIPSLSAGVNHICMYYNNSAASSGENRTGVWDSNYVMVQHLEETSGTIIDSTNRNNCTNNGMVLNAAGIIDGGDQADTNTDDLNCGASSTLQPTDAITVSAWVRSSDATTQYEAVGGFSSSTAWTNGYGMFFNSANTIRFFINAYNTNVASASITPSNWNYVVGTYDRFAGGTNEIKIYVNGVLGGTVDDYSTAINYAGGSLTITEIGGYTTDWFNGNVDEFRVSNIARSQDWINQSYQMVANQTVFVRSGAEENYSARKGIVPMISGSPFYTTSANPMYAANNSCLGNLVAGGSCNTTWMVNATGNANTTWEFFTIYASLNYSANVSPVDSSTVDIKIIDNIAPIVQYANISPSIANPTEDLNCSFMIIDASALDALTANVLWYRNGVLNYSVNVSVSNGVASSHILDEGNTSAGDIWFCGILPYDQINYGTQVNSSNISVLSSVAPVINEVQCQENGSTWALCSNVAFLDYLTAVRVNCTDADGSISNVTFLFNNTEDTYIYFNNVTTTYDNGWWVFNNSDITMNNSGTFNLYVTCTDNTSVSATDLTNWTLPWGTLSVSLVDPTSNTNVEYNQFFSFTAQVQCIGGECGNVEATLDPITTETADAGLIIDNDGGNDEEIGNYINTTSNDNTYMAIGETGNGDNANSQINLTFNISSLNIIPEALNSINLSLTYCHSGDNAIGSFACDGDAQEKGLSGAQDVWVYNYTSGAWIDIGDLNTANGGDEVTTVFAFSGNLSSYVSSNNLITIRTEIVSNNGGTNDDSSLGIDYAFLSIDYVGNKNGSVSTIIGTRPFYTTDANPQNYSHESCLQNMIEGSSACQVSWQVNATGIIGTTHVFWVNFNMTSNELYVNDDDTAHINITISSTSQVPPTVTLDSPDDNTITRNSTIIFNCSATDNNGLKNMTLYGNFNGAFSENGTVNISGTSNSTAFARTLNDGAYAWNCLAYDINANSDWGNSNRTLTIDTIAPTINLSYPVDGDNFTVSSVTFNFTATDSIDTNLTCNITIDSIVRDIGFSASNGSMASRTVSSLAQGYHYWNVTCVDNAGNINISQTRGFNITDIVPSVILITANLTYQQSPNITLQYNATDNNNITEARLYINGAYNISNNSVENGEISSFTLSNLDQGWFIWTVNVTDISNLTAQADPRIFIIDWTPPEINISYPSETYSTNSSIVEINFSVTDSFDYDRLLICNATVNGAVNIPSFSINNGSWTLKNLTNLTDGENYWNITCIDNSSNYNTSASRLINVSSPPTVVLNNPQDNHSQNSSSITLSYIPTDNTNLSSCTLILNGQTNVSNSTIFNGVINNFTLSGVASGNYTWTVNCSDTLGLSAVADPVRRFSIDTVAPAITLYNPTPDEIIYALSIVFNFSVIDSFDQYLICNITLDGAINISNIIAENNTFVNNTLVIYDEATHYWNVTCIDDAGNINVSETRNFTSYIPPEVNLVSPENQTVLNYSQNIAFLYTVSDSGTVENSSLIFNGLINQSNYSIDTDGTNYYYVNLTDGIYNWTINATDSTGLTGTDHIRVLTVDTTPPIINYITPTNGQTITSNNVTFMFNVTDNLDPILECSVDLVGEVNVLNVSNGDTGILSEIYPDGNYNWSVTCTDHANWTNTYVLINFTVDAPPNVTLNFPLSTYRTNNRNITFNYTPIDYLGFSNCSLYINGIYNVSNESQIDNGVPNYFNVSNMFDGLYNWTVLCIDEAPDLNTYSPAEQYFIIDNQGPNITLNYPGEGQAINENNVTFNWTATDYAGITITCNLTLDGTVNKTNISNISGAYFTKTVDGLADGSHTWSVSCIDDLGNLGISATGNFTINQPDLRLDTNRISFNNTNPDENQTLNITANVTNIGGVPANDVFVEFWDGAPGSGLYIGNYTATVNPNSSILFWVLWNITKGYHAINVNVDPYNAINELNETNNNATKNISLLLSSIVYPPNASSYVNPNVSINFTLQDFTGGLINYSVYVDSVLNGQNATVTDNVTYNITVPLTSGTHSIKIGATDALGRRKNSTAVYIIIDYTAPTPLINTDNRTWFNYPIPTINISATDDRVQNISYRIYVNGSMDSNGSLINGTSILINLSSLQNGSYEIIMEAWDDLNNTRNSTPKIIYIDTVQPEPLITTANNSWFNSSNPLIYFNITDNMATVFNYTFYVNGTYNASGNTSNISSSKNLQNLSSGTYQIILEAVDQAGNKKNSTPIIINTDIIKPNITLNYPADQINLTDNYVDLNFTPYDNMASYLMCNVTLDSNLVATNLNVTNGQMKNVSVTNLFGGYHYWNVTCADIAGNFNTSATYMFFVVMPDLYINSSMIFFNNSQPLENDTINITATIQNIGGNDAYNFVSQIRLNSQTGTLLANFTLNLSKNTSINISTTYTLPIGDTIFYVMIDVPFATNGIVNESNESNNNASKTATVSSWQYVLGYEQAKLAMYNSLYNIVFDWNVTNNTGKIFIADTDSNVDWLSLYAISRNTSEVYVSDDFYDIDRALGTENNSDSVNITYTSDGNPKDLKNLTIFRRQIIDIPTVNSTNNSNFYTGILWDSSDNGTQYNGTQDLIFVSRINKNAIGYNGTYDFELRVPAKLRQYKGSTDTVSLYAEVN